jgi:hypothetical protein
MASVELADRIAGLNSVPKRSGKGWIVVYTLPIPQARVLDAEMAMHHRCRDRAAS